MNIESGNQIPNYLSNKKITALSLFKDHFAKNNKAFLHNLDSHNLKRTPTYADSNALTIEEIFTNAEFQRLVNIDLGGYCYFRHEVVMSKDMFNTKDSGVYINFKDVEFNGKNGKKYSKVYFSYHFSVPLRSHKCHISYTDLKSLKKYRYNLKEGENFLFLRRNQNDGDIGEVRTYNNMIDLVNDKVDTITQIRRNDDPNNIDINDVFYKVMEYSINCFSFYSLCCYHNIPIDYDGYFYDCVYGIPGTIKKNTIIRMSGGKKNILKNIKKKHLLNYCKIKNLKGYDKYNKKELINFIINNFK